MVSDASNTFDSAGVTPVLIVPNPGTFQRTLSTKTLAIYESYIRPWSRWALRHGFSAMPAKPEDVKVYLKERARAGLAPITLQGIVQALDHHHEINGFDSPVGDDVLRVLHSICREYARPHKQARALTESDFGAIEAIECLPRRRGFVLESEETARDRGLKIIGMISLMRDGLLRPGETANLIWGVKGVAA